jgi:hypothetical protein
MKGERFGKDELSESETPERDVQKEEKGRKKTAQARKKRRTAQKRSGFISQPGRKCVNAAPFGRAVEL